MVTILSLALLESVMKVKYLLPHNKNDLFNAGNYECQVSSSTPKQVFHTVKVRGKLFEIKRINLIFFFEWCQFCQLSLKNLWQQRKERMLGSNAVYQRVIQNQDCFGERNIRNRCQVLRLYIAQQELRRFLWAASCSNSQFKCNPCDALRKHTCLAWPPTLALPKIAQSSSIFFGEFLPPPCNAKILM